MQEHHRGRPGRRGQAPRRWVQESAESTGLGNDPPLSRPLRACPQVLEERPAGPEILPTPVSHPDDWIGLPTVRRIGLARRENLDPPPEIRGRPRPLPRDRPGTAVRWWKLVGHEEQTLRPHARVAFRGGFADTHAASCLQPTDPWGEAKLLGRPAFLWPQGAPAANLGGAIMDRFLLSLAAFLGLLGVVAGALGAHPPDGWFTGPEELAAWNQAALFQLLHVLAILAIAEIPTRSLGRRRTVALLFLAGIMVFSGSIYGLLLGGPSWLGPVTPLGGILFLAGWAVLTWLLARGPGRGALN